MRKSIFAAIIVNCALALAIGIYTIVAMVGPKFTPTHTTQAVMLRVNDEVIFEDGSLKFTGLSSGEEAQLKKTSGNTYAAQNATKEDSPVTAKVTKKNGSTVTYTVTVHGYGDGSEENPFLISNVSHLKDLDKDNKNASSIYDRENLSKNYKLLSDIDLVEEGNWMPIGKITGSFNDQIKGNENDGWAIADEFTNSVFSFNGKFDGNGFVIKNMSIDVTLENFNNFAAITYYIDNENITVDQINLDLGFFGYTRGATITNLNFENANISAAANIATKAAVMELQDFDEVSFTGGTIYTASVGTVAGSAILGANINTISITNSTINAFSVLAHTNGIGGAVGSAFIADIGEIHVKDSKITANAAGTNIGGIVGNLFFATAMWDEGINGVEFRNSALGTFLEDILEDDLTVNSLYAASIENSNLVGFDSRGSTVGGAVAKAMAAEIAQVNVKSVKIGLAVNPDATTESPLLAGLVGLLLDVTTAESETFAATITDSSVSKTTIDAAASTTNPKPRVAGGLVVNNMGTIKDSTFAGNITNALVAGGIATYNMGTVEYSEEFDLSVPVVDATIAAYRGAAGLAYDNFGGKIAGYASVEEIKDEQDQVIDVIVTVTTVNVNLTWLGYGNYDVVEGMTNDVFMMLAGAATAEEASDIYMLAGLVANFYGSATAVLQDFMVNTTITNPINAAGAVGRVAAPQAKNINYGGWVFAGGKYYYNRSVNFTGGNIDGVVVESVVINTISENRGVQSTKRAAGAIADIGSDATILGVGVISATIGNKDSGASGLYVAGFAATVMGENISIEQVAVKNFSIYANIAGYTINGDKGIYVAGLIAKVEQSGTGAISIKDTIVMDGEITNGVTGSQSVASGAAGFIAWVSGNVTIGIDLATVNVIENVSVLSAHSYAAGVIGIAHDANISSITATGLSIRGYSVAGFAYQLTDVVGSDLAVTISEFKLNGIDRDSVMRFVSGFVAYATKTVTLTNVDVIFEEDFNFVREGSDITEIETKARFAQFANVIGVEAIEGGGTLLTVSNITITGNLNLNSMSDIIKNFNKAREPGMSDPEIVEN